MGAAFHIIITIQGRCRRALTIMILQCPPLSLWHYSISSVGDFLLTASVFPLTLLPFNFLAVYAVFNPSVFIRWCTVVYHGSNFVLRLCTFSVILRCPWHCLTLFYGSRISAVSSNLSEPISSFHTSVAFFHKNDTYSTLCISSVVKILQTLEEDLW